MSAPRITIADAARHAGETVSVPGWLYNMRKSGNIARVVTNQGIGTRVCVEK